ncbi:MAG TPA: diacylglycerol kinase family protein, partial [Pyrinomonadaceae bacterium]|nr:diacylglycerol kinase family protein [Pyrinomonadaceae bacterium]
MKRVPSPSLLVVVNYAAARARLAWPAIRETLAREGVRFEAHETRRAGDARERTRAALLEGYEMIASVGGDGTLSEVAAGFYESCEGLAENEMPRPLNAEATLAVLPAGTGDDFARGLGRGRRAVLAEWLQRLVLYCRGELDADAVRRVDLLSGSADAGARRFLCINAATLGIGAEVAARVAAQGARLRRLPGEARFACAALRALVAWRERRVRLRVGEAEWRECATNLIAVTNGAYAGGGMNFSPGARTDDGLLDVVTACGLTR